VLIRILAPKVWNIAQKSLESARIPQTFRPPHDFHHNLDASKGTKDCTHKAIAAGIPTYLIDSDDAVPRRLVPGDSR
jgi:hypothetical protein